MKKRNYLSEDPRKWISFYPRFEKTVIKYNQWSYFDERPELVFTLTTVLALFAMMVFPFLGWWWMSLGALCVFLFVPWGYCFVHLPIKTGKEQCEHPTWGFYFYSDSGKIPTTFWIYRGEKNTVLYLPWNLEWVRTSTYLKSHTWHNETKGTRKPYTILEENKIGGYQWLIDNRWTETHPYQYTHNSGETLELTATIHIVEREWRRRWMMWTKLFNLTRRVIEVEFSTDIGKGRGSWKGGCVGCSYDLLKNETALECLRRMEKERKF